MKKPSSPDSTAPVAKDKKASRQFFAISVILLVIVAAVILVFFRKNQPAYNEDLLPSEVQPEDIVQLDQAVVGSDLNFMELMATRQGSYVCRLEQDDVQITYYFNEDRLLIDMASKDGHFMTLINPDYTYNWDVNTKVGTKVARLDDWEEPMATVSSDEVMFEASDEPETIDMTELTEDGFDSADFQCQAWQVEASKFNPPEDVVFQDLSDMQQQMINAFAQ